MEGRFGETLIWLNRTNWFKLETGPLQATVKGQLKRPRDYRFLLEQESGEVAL